MDGSFPWGFGNFGIWLWSWPELSRSFLHRLEAVLGHPIRVVEGKI
jgi:hypothetical protein